ncbi:hypothetical protein M427DRAFT_56970 [Gonapodya prolifera JEL478]|uniref:Zn(2)-C6 fungal-type domain-containing protein n=1 Tax=Gonapodya prolifera (strain JEL478) TaxID=1344416 RepID=A0A139AE83_GONPJ|nr:hypothetical protein M427DRAFT_56970 [Gonapodya prolifera JEL478]|eukprot:KXS15070.1 hypothetical protein M427DRAFT_56970 [Gonapodya prolifera JEL478]
MSNTISTGEDRIYFSDEETQLSTTLSEDPDFPDSTSNGSGRRPRGSASTVSNSGSPRIKSKRSSSSSSVKLRKKVLRACSYCQRSHLTCDDERPCFRCVKRGRPDLCIDGNRKRAKYLSEEDPASNSSAQPAVTFPITTPLLSSEMPTAHQPQTSSAPDALAHLNSSFPLSNPLGNMPLSLPLQLPNQQLLPLQLQAYPFGSEAANLEFSILSNMLAQSAAMDASGGQGGASGQVQGAHFGLADVFGAQQTTGATGAAVPAPPNQQSSRNQPLRRSNTTGSTATGAPLASSASGTPANSKHHGHHGHGHHGHHHGVYGKVTKPYDYREGFHYLVKYVKERMEKPDIMRICRALAHFRPSFMAQIMNLSEEDLIFMEQCFQRTLQEFDKLINFSGTPTVVWRRTGEIALVGKEFCLLTQWTREQLFGKKTYIYELMDTSSAVSYWELFSMIAFDNSQQSVMTTCTLVGPQGRKVPCAFCFTIKRDIFEVPLCVVGNFLPLFDRGPAAGIGQAQST